MPFFGCTEGLARCLEFNHHMRNSTRTRAAVDTALSELIADAERKGWQPAEIVMALADAAEDYILLLAQRGAVRH